MLRKKYIGDAKPNYILTFLNFYFIQINYKAYKNKAER